jgi:hypothetical protein
MPPKKEDFPLVSEHKSRAQLFTRADLSVLRLDHKVSELISKLFTEVSNGVITAVEMSVIDTKESVSRYFISVLNCLDLEDVPEAARQQDTHFLQWSSLDELLDKSQTKVRIYRADFDSRSNSAQSDALSSMPNNSAPRVNTSLKPSDLDISCSLPDFRI